MTIQTVCLLSFNSFKANTVMIIALKLSRLERKFYAEGTLCTVIESGKQTQAKWNWKTWTGNE